MREQQRKGTRAPGYKAIRGKTLAGNIRKFNLDKQTGTLFTLAENPRDFIQSNQVYLSTVWLNDCFARLTLPLRPFCIPLMKARLARFPGPSTVFPSSSGPQEAEQMSIWFMLRLIDRAYSSTTRFVKEIPLIRYLSLSWRRYLPSIFITTEF